MDFKKVSLKTVKHTGAIITRHSCSVDVLYFSECFIENVLHFELRWQKGNEEKGPWRMEVLIKGNEEKGPRKLEVLKGKDMCCSFFFFFFSPWSLLYIDYGGHVGQKTLTSGQRWWYRIVILRLCLAGPWHCLWTSQALKMRAFGWLMALFRDQSSTENAIRVFATVFCQLKIILLQCF